MIGGGQFFSGTWDTRFLELPPGKVLLTTLKNIPERPTAEIELRFVAETNSLNLQVIESKNQPAMINDVARWDGNTLEFCFPKWDENTKEGFDTWSAWDTHKRWSNE